jgi:poly(3-hydroxyalkanoate) depolymerase
MLCCGIGAGAHAFDRFIRHLDPRRPVITFNPPGLGSSPEPRAPYTFATLARNLGHEVRRLGYDRVDVLGLSWGGAFAQQFALQNPQRCRRLVLVATLPGWMCVPPSPRTMRHLLTPQRHRDPEYARSIAGELYGGSARTDPGLATRVLHENPTFPSVRSYLYQVGAITGWTSLPALPLLRQRTLVLAGDDDPMIRVTNARMMAAALPNGRLHLYTGGHLALLSEAAELAPVVENFLDEA